MGHRILSLVCGVAADAVAWAMTRVRPALPIVDTLPLTADDVEDLERIVGEWHAREHAKAHGLVAQERGDA